MYDGIKQAYGLVSRIETLRAMRRKLTEYKARLYVENLMLELEKPEERVALYSLIDAELERLEKLLKEVQLND